ncbi:scopoletin glucosyltransferase-like [Panicum miliaceum]|uniref:Glycosyltransferase n=1 Tax=Panicum miliaceum TaxID=4540 RepID=A0A3L6TSK7_PANMI|nr:scopoletin glucosyltransferase-like [Panicum miliaceum]
MATTAATTRDAGDAAAASGAGRRLRVFFLPSFARGHLIPQTDLACLMAAARPGEVEATMVVTLANAALIAPTVARAAAAGHAVRVLRHPFPDVGLGDGVECLATAPAHDAWRVYHAMELVQTTHESLLREHRPDAIVSDVPFWWTTVVAAELGVPRLTFHPVGVFPQLAMNNLFKMRADIIRISSAPGTVVSVPGLPGQEITIPVSELPSFLVQDDHLSKSWEQIKASQLAGFGVIVNTFVDLEQPYCEEFSRVDARRAYFVGPLAQPSCSTVHRGGDSNVDCLSWLSTKPSRSVVYVCFGSWARFSASQSRELALGLEASNQPFLWVVRSNDSDDGQWAPEGWEQRVAGRGMVVRGWAPQVAVLAHPSVGAFLTHCGWNSVLEAASTGVPVLTWPLVFEQFINERLVTGVAAFGARVWEGGTRGERAGEAETAVPAEAIARAVAVFIEGGAQRDGVEARARELAGRARAAVGENGSSWRDIHRLIDDLVQARASGLPQESPIKA